MAHNSTQNRCTTGLHWNKTQHGHLQIKIQKNDSNPTLVLTILFVLWILWPLRISNTDSFSQSYKWVSSKSKFVVLSNKFSGKRKQSNNIGILHPDNTNLFTWVTPCTILNFYDFFQELHFLLPPTLSKWYVYFILKNFASESSNKKKASYALLIFSYLINCGIRIQRSGNVFLFILKHYTLWPSP